MPYAATLGSAIITCMERELLTDEALESSAIVANCRMNREREIVGKTATRRICF